MHALFLKFLVQYEILDKKTIMREHSVLRVILTPQISKMIETPIFGPG